jgi:hypothetical protein
MSDVFIGSVILPNQNETTHSPIQKTFTPKGLVFTLPINGHQVSLLITRDDIEKLLKLPDPDKKQVRTVVTWAMSVPEIKEGVIYEKPNSKDKMGRATRYGSEALLNYNIWLKKYTEQFGDIK